MDVSAQLHVPATLPLGKNPQYPLDRRLGSPQNRFGRCEEEKNFAPAGNRAPAVQPVAYQLRFPGSRQMDGHINIIT
jgi:hypothetical protein